MTSIMCTGTRMVRAWSAMARVTAWRFHQLALGVLSVHVALDNLTLRAAHLLGSGAVFLFQLFQVNVDMFLLLLVFGALLFIACAVHLLLQRPQLPVKGPHLLGDRRHFFNQPFALSMGIANAADDLGNSHLVARDFPAATNMLFRILLGADAGQLFFQLASLVIMHRHLFNGSDGGFGARLGYFFSDLFLIEHDDFFDGADAAFQVFANGDDFPDGNAAAGNSFEHTQVPALKAPGNFYFTLAGEKRYGAHFAQVDADGVSAFFS